MKRDLRKDLEPKNVVEEFMIGNTHVRISDDYCVKTREEAQAILDKIARDAYPHLVNAMLEKEKLQAEQAQQAEQEEHIDKPVP